MIGPDLIGALGVEAEALARPGAPSSAGALPGRRLADGRHHEGVHAHLRVEHLLLREPGVHHVIGTQVEIESRT